MNWEDIQREIDSCQDCIRIGGELIAEKYEAPKRPPAINQHPILFISEAPPKNGGFWNPAIQDDLRKNLFEILLACNVSLSPNDHSQTSLTDFCERGLFLIQALKWPLKKSARNLRPNERKLIEHTCETHLVQEFQALQPLAIICLGRVSSYACSLCFPKSEFKFLGLLQSEWVIWGHFRSPVAYT